MPTVGIVGAGQLARMMHQAAIAIGVDTVVLANGPDESAARVAAGVEIGAPSDLAALERLAARSDVVTFDHELVDPGHLHALEAAGHVLRPGPRTLQVAVDKLEQRRTFEAAGLPLPAWARAESARDVDRFAETQGWPIVLKAARGGYDGRGVWICNSAGEVAEVPRMDAGGLFVVEQFVPIDQEMAVLVARTPGGEMSVYPVVETLQLDGICHEVVVPARQPGEILRRAEDIGRQVAETVGSIGNLAVELFVSRGRVLINEIAARPHNAGHFSIEGSVTSQFENHLRAVLGWPLGSTALEAPAAAMVNIFGNANLADPASQIPEALGVRGAHLHWYGKSPRPGRKLGHVTALAATVEEALAIARRAAYHLDPRGEL